MSRALTAILIICSLFFSAAQSVAAKLPISSSEMNSTPVTFVLCQNKKDVRTIRVDKQSQKSECLTYYTRGGVDHEVGYGHYLSSCNKIVNNIKTNLEKASWNCRDIQSVTMTSSLTSSAKKTDANP